MRRGVACAALLAACGARSALDDDPWSPDALYCTGGAFTGRPSCDTLLVAGVPRSLRGHVRWSVADAVTGSSPTLRSDGGETANFTADREGDYTVRVAVPAPGDAGAGAEVSCTLSVQLHATGPTATCPSDVTVAPLTRVPLRASAAGDHPVTAYRWTLVDAPAASARPAPDPGDATATRFTPDAVGDYRLRFTATDDRGLADACETAVHAVSPDGLRVELWWDPPGRTCPTAAHAQCDHSDVDLHLLALAPDAAWRGPADCYYGDCTGPSRLHWGPSATGVNDPHLDLDDTDGHGPENIDVPQPAAGVYRIGVHYYDPHGAGPEAASVAVFCGGATPVAVLGPVTLNAPSGGWLLGDLWVAADVRPRPGGGCDVRPVARAGAPWITSLDEALRTPGPPSP